MEPKKVTAEQIRKLYAFTLSHFVEYYDLQTELADHLANAIEAQWEQNPTLSFEDALQLEFKKFGVFGFSDVVQERQKALGKKYNKLLWRYFKQYLSLPRLVLTVLLMAAMFEVLLFEKKLLVVFILALLVIIVARLIILKSIYGKKVKNTGKRWLLEDIIVNCGGIAGLISLPFQFLHLAVNDNALVATLWLVSVIYVLMALASYIMIFVIPAKAEEHLTAVYPEYNL